jgi:hypothetical protein
LWFHKWPDFVDQRHNREPSGQQFRRHTRGQHPRLHSTFVANLCLAKHDAHATNTTTNAFSNTVASANTVAHTTTNDNVNDSNGSVDSLKFCCHNNGANNDNNNNNDDVVVVVRDLYVPNLPTNGNLTTNNNIDGVVIVGDNCVFDTIVDQSYAIFVS